VGTYFPVELAGKRIRRVEEMIQVTLARVRRAAEPGPAPWRSAPSLVVRRACGNGSLPRAYPSTGNGIPSCQRAQL
jgi:hypothetical protein